MINAYVSMINQHHQDSFAFNTFFFTMLQHMRNSGQYNFRKLQRIVEKKKV